MATEEISNKALGQINLMQSMVTMLPDINSIMDFTCRGLLEIPGVRNANYTLTSKEHESTDDAYKKLTVEYDNTIFAELNLYLHNKSQFAPYTPFLENFATMLGVICKERQQKEENQKLSDELEARVQERTHQLHEREEDLLITLNSIGDGVITTDLNGNITRLNPVSEALTGWALSEAIGKPLTDIFHIISAETGEVIENPVNKVLDTENVIGLSSDTILISRHKKQYHIADSAAPIRDSHGYIRGVVLVFHDVTEEYAMQQELQQARKMEAVGKLAGGIAHDFNNVLSGIIGAADLLCSLDLQNKTATKYANLIITSAQRAADLTHKLSAFGRKGKLKKTPIMIHALIEDTIILLERSLDKKIEIRFTPNAEIDHIMGDASLLQNCILNIGINASHAMPNGGIFDLATSNDPPPGPALNQREGKQQNYIHLSLRDTGSGIAEEHLKKIFDPFFTTKKSGEGTGLGLSTTYRTIQDHKGFISVESELNKGSSFHIYLPIHTQKKEVVKNPSPHLHKGKGTILAVDDEDSVRLILDAILTQLGYTVLLASNGQEALKVFSSHQGAIDLVILDMIMPKMNGSETYYRLKELQPDIKVLICSGYSNEGEVAKLQKQGIVGLITKPFTIEKMSSILAEAI